MIHPKVILVISICALFLAGCGQVAALPTAMQTQPVAPVETATPVFNIVTPWVIYITATPGPTLAVPSATPTAVEPTATQIVPAAINITSVVDMGGGNVQVIWDAVGNFSTGFEVVWSATNQSPSFPTDSTNYVSDPNARSAVFQGDPGSVYFVRVCRYVNNTCDVYSNTSYVLVYGPTLMPVVPTAVPGNHLSNTSKTPVGPYIYITYMKSAGAGAAVIYWRVYGTFNNGYLILYGNDPTQLVYGESRQISVPHGYYRVFTVTGYYNTTYYFRMCRYTGTNCDLASNVYAFTFTGE